MRDTVAVPVAEPSQVGEARRIASALAVRSGLDEVARGKVALAASELAGNLARHAKGGELVISAIARESVAGVEFLAIDRGPGMADFRRCLADGYSTAGTPGTGLGAVARLADEFDAQTAVGQGTVLLARIWDAPPEPPSPRHGPALEVGSVCLPVAGERECGDAWAMLGTSTARALIIVADGLGHGPLAAAASGAAVASMRAGGEGASPSEVLSACHRALRGTRGAADAVGLVDRDRREVRYAGAGNISGTVISADARHGLVSLPGIVGVDVRKVQEFAQPWPPGSLLVMHSDGLATHWKLDRNSPLASKHPGVIAGVLYRDHARGRDDATVVVAREGGPLSG